MYGPTGDKLVRKEEVILGFFDVFPEIGEVYWKVNVDSKFWKTNWAYTNFIENKAGKRVIFSVNSEYGHLRVKVIHTQIYAHHIVWFSYYGQLPSKIIDHIDGNSQNNKITNLREVSAKESSRNRKMQSNNSSGFTGVTWSGVASKWLASAKVNSQYIHLGYFDKIEDAATAREDWMKNNRVKYGFTERHGIKDVTDI